MIESYFAAWVSGILLLHCCADVLIPRIETLLAWQNDELQYCCWVCASISTSYHQGRLAQMAERSLSMREAPGSIPGLSIGCCDMYLHPIPSPEGWIVSWHRRCTWATFCLSCVLTLIFFHVKLLNLFSCHLVPCIANPMQTRHCCPFQKHSWSLMLLFFSSRFLQPPISLFY